MSKQKKNSTPAAPAPEPQAAPPTPEVEESVVQTPEAVDNQTEVVAEKTVSGEGAISSELDAAIAPEVDETIKNPKATDEVQVVISEEAICIKNVCGYNKFDTESGISFKPNVVIKNVVPNSWMIAQIAAGLFEIIEPKEPAEPAE